MFYKPLRSFMVVVTAVCVVNTGWTENIAFLVPGSLFIAGEDPINIPDDKVFLLETMELNEPGLHWLVLHLENDLGHTVNIYSSDDDDPGVVEDANDLIFVSEALGSGSIGSDYQVTNKPFVTTEFFLLDDMGLASGSSFTGGASNDTGEIKILNTNHPIAQGLPETFGVTATDPATGQLAIVTFGAVVDQSILTSGEIVAVLPTSINHSANPIPAGDPLPDNAPFVIAAEAGAVGNDTRWVFIGFSDVAPNPDLGGVPENRTLALLNENGIKLLDNTIAWALGQEPASVTSWSLY